MTGQFDFHDTQDCSGTCIKVIFGQEPLSKEWDV